MLRTLRACGVSARMLNGVLVIELVSLALVAGLIGLVCGYLIAAALLPDVAASLRGLYGAQIPGQLTLKPRMVDRRHRHQRSGRAGRGRRQPDQGDPPAGARHGAALCLATGAAPLADLAERAGARGVCRRGGLLWFGDSLISGFAVLAALLLGAALILPMILEIVLSLGQRNARSARSASGSGPTAASSFPDCRWR